MQPYEIIAAPLTLWLAPVGESFPTVDAAPAGNWAKIGTSGDLNYDEGGVTIAHQQELAKWRALGSTGPRKAFRTAEDLIIRVTLADMSLEELSKALNHNAVATTAAGASDVGFKTLDLYQGLTVTTKALLVRGVSPEDESQNAQWQVPVVYQSASPEYVGAKDNPMAYQLEFTALEDPDAATAADRFGSLVVWNAAATG